MRGRKPKPMAKVEQDGDSRKIGVNKLRAKIAAEPLASRGLPPCPRHLKGRARAAWKFWSVELADMDLDRRPDAMMLEGACVNYGRAVEADLIVARDGMMVEESYVDKRSGEKVILKIKYHPGITVSNSEWRQVRAFCSEFGLSPVSRTRLAVADKDKPGEDLARLLSQPREPKTTAVQ